MTSVKGMDPVYASLSDLHLPPEEEIKQVGDIYEVINSKSFQYLT